MNRRALLAGASLIAASHALAQPMSILGPVGAQVPRGGPLWSLPTGPAGPTLDLSFTTGTLDPSVAFTRASTATYFNSAGVMQTAATNAARFDYDPAALTLRGLLIEEARTNNVSYSVPDTTNWTMTNSALTVAATAAPDGTTTGARLLDNATSGAHQANAGASFTFASSTIYTMSVFAKAATASGLQLATSTVIFTGSPYANFNLAAGTVGAVGGGATASMQNCGNGWYRCIMTATSNAGGATAPLVVLLTNNNYSATRAPTYVGTGTGVYLWGAQLETGAFPTSYVPTSGAVVTRQADVATIASIPGRNATAESYQADILMFNTYTNNRPVISNPSNQRAPILLQSNQHASIYDASAGTAQTTNSYSVGAVAKIATTWANPLGQACMNAGAVGAASSMTTGFAGLTTIKFGGDNTTTDYLCGYIRRFRYWPRVLSNAEMQQVTT